MREYYLSRAKEWLDLAKQYERCPEDQQKAAGAKEARENAEYYIRLAEQEA